MKLTRYLMLLLFCVITLTVMSYLEDDDETFTLPDGYQGPVLVIYNQADGEPVEIEDGVRLFEIPSNGLLVTQSDKPKGVGDSFWYRDEFGTLTQKLLFNQNCVIDVPGDPLIVCVMAESLILRNQTPPRHSIFIVGAESRQNELAAGYYEWSRDILTSFLGD